MSFINRKGKTLDEYFSSFNENLIENSINKILKIIASYDNTKFIDIAKAAEAKEEGFEIFMDFDFEKEPREGIIAGMIVVFSSLYNKYGSWLKLNNEFYGIIEYQTQRQFCFPELYHSCNFSGLTLKEFIQYFLEVWIFFFHEEKYKANHKRWFEKEDNLYVLKEKYTSDFLNMSGKNNPVIRYLTDLNLINKDYSVTPEGKDFMKILDAENV